MIIHNHHLIGLIGCSLVLLQVLLLSSAVPLGEVSQPPVAKKVRHVMEKFGDVRVDNYYWLRDDNRTNTDVLSYLEQENNYTDSVMSGTKKYEDMLYAKMRGRMKEGNDISVPQRNGNYYYYTKTLEGKDYVQHCRRPISNGKVGAPPSVNDTMPTGPDAPEHVILDENIRAQGHEYYKIGAFKVSPNNKFVAYSEDTKGNEIYTVYVIDAETGAPVANPIAGTSWNGVKWAGDEALVYITRDEIHRPYKAWLHKLGTQQSNDSLLYHEKDDTFGIVVQPSETGKFLFVCSGSSNTMFNFFLDVLKPEDGLKVLTPRVDGISDTSVSHRGDHFYILRTSDEFFNSEVIACPVNNTSATTVVLPHRESVKIEDLALFKDHLVVLVREKGIKQVTIYGLPDVGEPVKSLEDGHTADFVDPIYSVSVDYYGSQFSSNILRLDYSSLKTPLSVIDYDLEAGISVFKKIQIVLGGFKATNYVTKRIWANASDGTQIPISIVYRKDLVKLDGSDPLLLYGYGAYEISEDPSFEASRLSLLDRGFVYAIAHIRGGAEMGGKWYENGKLLKKKNTFTDFIACAEYLIENKYCSKEKLSISGESAGGLLIGAVLNMRPDLFKAAVAGVPFVDVLTTMLDPTIPLTTGDYGEWGDPQNEEFYFYIKSYSPVDNIKAQNYPNILVTAGLYDSRVIYSEPSKFVAKLRDMKTDDNILLFKCDLSAGHLSTGRFERLKKDAFVYAFIMKALNLIPDLGSGHN